MAAKSPFGKRVRRNRLELDLTQEELARRVGCAAITVRRIEAGNLRPSKQIAELLAKALGIAFEDQAEFIRQARAVKPGGKEPSPTPTPQVSRDEIGLEDLSGRAIRGYTLGERLGRGGFGVVYRAVQPLVDREVAVKIVLPEYADHPEFIRRFESEAQIVARLEHPHIVPLYDYWREPSVAYLVMRLLRGGNIEDRLKAGALPLDEVSQLIDQIASALHIAHRVGVVHRDIKPANVLLDEDSNAYLTDFGIAKSQSNWETETHIGAFLGSPAYTSPEQIRAESISPQADIYSLGVLVYELLTAKQPFDGPTPVDLAQQHLNTAFPSLIESKADLPPAIDAVISRAAAKDPRERYGDVREFAADLREVAETGRLSSRWGRGDGSIEITNPYKGLRAFGEADAADFHGRRTLVQQLLGRLAEDSELNRFLAIIGPSGSGKSSVAKAGLIPAIRRGALPGSENWFVIDFAPGPHPLEELAESLERVSIRSIDDPILEMQRDVYGLTRILNHVLPDDGSTELVILIDQFEEIFTHVESEVDRSRFLEMLVATAMNERSRARFIVTLRADFVDQPLRYTDFGELLKNRSELVLPLTPDELEHAIRNPAERIGLSVEPELIAEVIGDVTDQPGSLPLMQYALTEIFERRSNSRLTQETYRLLGGVRGALARRADDVFASLTEAGQAAAHQMFLRLVTLGEGVEDTRRRVPRSELVGVSDEVDEIINRFASHRLLTLDLDPATREPTVEVAHEALLREWPRLKEWTDISRADIRKQQQLARAARDWNNANRDESFLLRGARLSQFEIWAGETELALSTNEQAMLDASLAQRTADETLEAERVDREERMEEIRRKLTRALVSVMAIGLLAALGLSAFALNQRDRALIQASIGLASQAELELKGSVPERAVLLALEALEDYPYTWQAERALANAVGANHLRLILQHDASVRDAFWSPDESRIATASDDGTARVWDSETGMVLASFEHGAPVVNALWSPNSEWLLTSSTDGAVHVWDLETGIRVLFLTGQEEFGSVDWSPSGHRFITTRDDGGITVWNPESGVEIVSIPDQRVCSEQAIVGQLGCGAVSAWSPSGDRLLTRNGSGTFSLWNSETAELLQRVAAHNGVINGLSWSPDGSMILSAGVDGVAHVWSAETGEQLTTFSAHTDPINSASWSPLGDRILTTSDDLSAKIWSATTGEELISFEEHVNHVLTGTWNSTGDRVLSTGSEGTIFLWEAGSGALIDALLGHTGFVVSAQWSHSGDAILSAGLDGSARIWRVDAESIVLEIPSTEAGQWGVAWSPDGSRLARSHDDGTVRVFDATTGERLLTLDGHDPFAVDIAWSPDGDRIYSIGALTDGTANVWESASGALLTTFAYSEAQLWYSSWSPDGTRVVTPSADGSVLIWDAATGDLLLTFEQHDGFAVKAKWSPDGQHIASADLAGGLMVWDAESGEVLMDLFPDDYKLAVTTLAWSPDGGRLAAHSDDGLRIWDSTSGELLVSGAGHGAWAFGFDWFPSGNRIASLGAKGLVKVWDAQTGRELLSFQSLPGYAHISPDGMTFAVAQIPNGPTTLYTVWSTLGELIEYARECCVFRALTPEEREQFGLPPN